jgi:hypothetical protein
MANKMGGTCSDGGIVYWTLVKKPEGRRPVLTPRRKWKNNIKMDLKKLEWGLTLE